MSEISELNKSLTGVIGEVQAAHATLVEGMGRLSAHESNPEAHGLGEADSPFRKAIESLVAQTMLDGETGEAAQKIIASRVAAAISSSLPDAIAKELGNPLSALSSLVAERINEDVNKKIENGDLGDAVTSLISETRETAKLAKKTADSAATNAAAALATANGAKTTADGALPRNGNAASASKLATARTLQVDLGSTASASFDGSANKDIGVKGALPLANGGTGGNTAAAACDALGAVKKSGARGALAGSETASVVTGSQSIAADSADCQNITTSGAVTLTFTPAAANVRAVKVLCLTAGAATTLSVSGAEWANNGSAPNWGSAGKRLVLLAHFVAGLVVLSVADNTE